MNRRPPETFLFGLAVFAVYLTTLHRGLPGGDSGELITVASTLGIAHPPGYPLYTMLGKLFSYLPIGSVALRLNLFSALCGAGAAALLFATLKLLTGNKLPALFAASLFALSFEVWRYASVAEVFALNNLLCAGLFYCLAKWQTEGGHEKWLFAVFFLSGLCASHHHQSAFVVLPILILVSIEQRKNFSAKQWAGYWGTFALGLTPYLYLPLRAAMTPPLMWGDVTTWQGFLTHFLRREYGTFQLVAGLKAEPGVGIRNTVTYLWELTRDGFGIAWLAFFAALVKRQSLMRRGPLFLAAVISFVVSIVVFNGLANITSSDPFYRGILARFWQQPHFCFFLLAGLGGTYLFDKRTARPVLATFFIAALGFGVGKQAHIRLERYDLFNKYGREILSTLPKDAVLLTCGDVVGNSVRYLQNVEGVRRDVVTLEIAWLRNRWFQKFISKRHPTIVTKRDGMDLMEFLDPNIRNHVIYAAGQLCNFGRNPYLAQTYGEWYEGCANRVVKRVAMPESYSEYDRGAQRLFSCLQDVSPDRFADDTWEKSLFVALQDTRAEFLSRMETYVKKHPSQDLSAGLRNLASTWESRQRQLK
jgi:hypothetical protein